MIQIKDTEVKGKSAILTFGKPINAAGNEAPVQAGTVRFRSTNESVATVSEAPAPDGGVSDPYAVQVNFSGNIGSTDVVIEADADLNEDPGAETIISGLESFVIDADQATGFQTPVLGTLFDTPAAETPAPEAGN